jgi:hypothetical protein
LTSAPALTIEMRLLANDGSRQCIHFPLQRDAEMQWDGEHAIVNGQRVAATLQRPSQRAITDTIQFAPAVSRDPARYPVLRERDQLQHWLESGQSVF